MKRILEHRGQGTVEAAFALPILFLLMLMLLQPGIVLYDRIVMKNAIEEGFRMMATTASSDADQCRDFIKHRLAAIPPHDLFHVKGDGVDYAIQIEGGADERSVQIIIDNELKPLPIIGAAMGALGATDERGYIRLTESIHGTLQPGWALESAPFSQADRVKEW